MAKKASSVNIVTPLEFTERSERPVNYSPVIFNKDTQKTELLIPDALLGGESVNLLWSPTGIYAENEIREFNLKLWKSLSSGNEGNAPYTGSPFWEEVSKSEAGYTPLWAAGAYLTAYAKVLKLNSEDNKLYEYVLRAPAPFESVDFDAELTAGDWQVLGGSGGGSSIEIATNSDMDAGTNDTKAVSPLKFVYGITTRVFSSLKTISKNIQGAINELWDKLLLKAETHPSWDASTVPTADDIVINEVAGTLTFGTINGAPISVNNPAIYFIDINGKANRFLITAPVVFDWSAKTEGVWWFWFDETGAKVQQTAIPPNFGEATPLYRMYYSAVDGVVNTRAAEFHPNTQSAIEHEWKHFTFGAVWESGFQLVCNPLTSGAPAANGLNTCISLTGGTNLDDNFRYSIVNNTSGAAWSQDLGTTTAANITTANGLLARVSYNDSLGRLRLLPATRFPFHFVGDVPQTIGADGTVTPVPNNYFFVTFTYCLQDDKAGEAVRVRSYVSSFATIDAARAAQWEDLVGISPTLGDKEIRPLHRHIWERRTAYDNAVKQSVLRETLDIRKERVKSISVSSTTILSSNVALATPLLGATNQDAYNVANEADKNNLRILIQLGSD